MKNLILLNKINPKDATFRVYFLIEYICIGF